MTIMMHALHELAPQSDGKRSWGAYQVMPRSQVGRMSTRMTALVAAILVAFAVFHVVGGTLLMGRADQPPVRSATLISGD
jgi:hypothetical protein